MLVTEDNYISLKLQELPENVLNLLPLKFGSDKLVGDCTLLVGNYINRLSLKQCTIFLAQTHLMVDVPYCSKATSVKFFREGHVVMKFIGKILLEKPGRVASCR